MTEKTMTDPSAYPFTEDTSPYPFTDDAFPRLSALRGRRLMAMQRSVMVRAVFLGMLMMLSLQLMMTGFRSVGIRRRIFLTEAATIGHSPQQVTTLQPDHSYGTERVIVGRDESSPGEGPSVNDQSLESPASDRPIITTYYNRAPTDMSIEADFNLLQVWKTAWYDAGWQPRILSLVDAMKHPEFNALMDLLGDRNVVSPYNLECYIRWIAMAANGGGWMSDYDTLPLNPFLRHGRDLPNGGMMTIYDQSVPDLVSGTAHEYYRMVKRIGESLNRHVHATKWHNERAKPEEQLNHTRWSDMYALQELLEHHPGIFKTRQEVLHGEDALTGRDWTEGDCRMGHGMRAIHFSHRAMFEGKSPYRGSIHRPTVATQWLNMWRHTCAPTRVDD